MMVRNAEHPSAHSAAARQTMRAVVITQPGDPGVLELRDVPRPSPGISQLLVRVKASALNRADLLQRQGRYPAPADAPADIPGLEFAGEVAECGPKTSLWKEGDRVFGITSGGGQAEYLVAHERMLARIPDRLSFVEAAAVPEVFITAHDALIAQAGLRAGEAVLIHAVGSGVGLAAVQLVRAMSALAYGTARTQAKIDRAHEVGLQDGIVVGEEREVIADAVRSWTAGQGVPVVLDLVGGPYLVSAINCAATLGRIVLVSTMGGADAPVPLSSVLTKRLTIRGTILRSRPLEEKIVATRAFAAQVVPLLARGVLQPNVDVVLPLDHVRAAHERMAANATAGKIVLTVA